MSRYLTAANVLAIKAALYGALVLLLLWGVVDALAAPLAQEGGPPFNLPVGSDYVMATLVVGFLMSPIISALTRSGWESHHRAIAAFVWCLVASITLLVAGDQLHWIRGDYRSLFGTFLVVFVMATGLYKFYFESGNLTARIGLK